MGIDRSTEIIGRIANQADAEVHVLKTPGRALYGHGWKCTGCRQSAGTTSASLSLRADDARKAAEDHADSCRFLPPQS